MRKWRTISYQEWLDVPRFVVWIEFTNIELLLAMKTTDAHGCAMKVPT